jgi:hypothetical protein
MEKILTSAIIMTFFLRLPSLGPGEVINFDKLTLGSTIPLTPGIIYPDVNLTYIWASYKTFFILYNLPEAMLSRSFILGSDSNTENDFYKATFSPGVWVCKVSVDLEDWDTDLDEFVLYTYNNSNVLIESASRLNPATQYGRSTPSVSTSRPIVYPLSDETGNLGVNGFHLLSTTSLLQRPFPNPAS